MTNPSIHAPWLVSSWSASSSSSHPFDNTRQKHLKTQMKKEHIVQNETSFFLPVSNWLSCCTLFLFFRSNYPSPKAQEDRLFFYSIFFFFNACFSGSRFNVSISQINDLDCITGHHTIVYQCIVHDNNLSADNSSWAMRFFPPFLNCFLSFFPFSTWQTGKSVV